MPGLSAMFKIGAGSSNGSSAGAGSIYGNLVGSNAPPHVITGELWFLLLAELVLLGAVRFTFTHHLGG